MEAGNAQPPGFSDPDSGKLLRILGSPFMANYGNPGSEGPGTVCSHHVYGSYEALLVLFGASIAA